MSKEKQYHFLLIYPLQTAPSQRFRFEQYFSLLEKQGIRFSTNCFYDQSTFRLVYKKGGKLALAFHMLLCFFRRCLHMFTLGKYERIFIQRGAAPFGPPVFEWIIHFIWRKPIVYDYDDAIWLQPQKKTTWSKRLIKAYYKVGMICNWSHTIVAGNEYLANYARQFNLRVMVIPTVVDTETRFVPSPVIKSSRKPVIGWTGSHTTLFYLEKMESVLLQLKAEHDFELLVIANKPPVFSELSYRFVRWTEDSEIEDLGQIDIGLMPLTDDEWTKGKCGFKLIQYLSLGIPAVADPVGVNKLIIEDGINGFLCKTNDEWTTALIALINDTELRHTMGREGRAKIVNQYSLRSQTTQFLSLFN